MIKTIEARFDGRVFLPTEPLALEPNTCVWITIETIPSATDESTSFLRTARALNLDGPPDWSENVDKYLYGGEPQHDESKCVI